MGNVEEILNQHNGIESYNSNSKVDMSVIDRIKQMRSQSREHSEVLYQRREDTIKLIQINQLKNGEVPEDNDIYTAL